MVSVRAIEGESVSGSLNVALCLRVSHHDPRIGVETSDFARAQDQKPKMRCVVFPSLLLFCGAAAALHGFGSVVNGFG